MSTLVQVSNLCMDFYTKEEEKHVLENINFSVESGEILAIIGPSGSGKSTILNIIAGLLDSTSGEIQVPKEIGYMFQKDLLFEWRTIMDNITLGLKIKNALTDERKEEIERLLHVYNLWEARNYYPSELSGGMRQRVALIRTLIMNPNLILLDEPFSGLDAQTRLIVTNDIYSIITKEKKTAILVTHDISEAISMADNVLVLSSNPATVKHIHAIELTLTEPKTALTAKTAPEFQHYYDLFWKELDCDEIN